MKSRDRKDSAVPPTDAAATPFFARFLEDQHAADADAKPAAMFQTLKYPSDRDEDDVYSHAEVGAAQTNYEPSRRTLKYPSDRDDIDPPFVVPYGNTAGAS
jgi:hypothetical protein